MACKYHPQVETGLVKCYRCGQKFCSNCYITIQGKTYCVDCKEEQLKDIESGVSEDTVKLASLGARWGGQIVDVFVVAMPVVVFMAILSGLGYVQPDRIEFVTLLGIAVVYMIYEGLFLQSRGQTLGKMATKTKVVAVDGSDISPSQAWGRAFTRQLLTLFNFLPQLGFLDILPIVGKQKAILRGQASELFAIA
jgi:uncharacterized RDD family membrane protein YckC